MSLNNIALCFKAPDRSGIVAEVLPILAERGCDVREAHVYGDAETGQFFTRIAVTTPLTAPELSESLNSKSDELKIDFYAFNLDLKIPVLIAVSKFGHCLVDLIHKQEIGQLPIDIVAVVSNHESMRKTVEWHGLPFHHLPMNQGKEKQEQAFLDLISQSGAELTILARYMQILSDEFSRVLTGRCINIHHSFLPSFKGAKPYHQAHARGVKIIGATAHYVTSDLDEGPIIEQDVRRVSHSTTSAEMVAIGREVEASVLSRAVRWHAEHRVFLNGNKTVVLL